jgi:hypothetical protein
MTRAVMFATWSAPRTNQHHLDCCGAHWAVGMGHSRQLFRPSRRLNLSNRLSRLPVIAGAVPPAEKVRVT